MNLQVGDQVICRISGNPYCKDRVRGTLIKIGASYGKVQAADGLVRRVRKEWIKKQNNNGGQLPLTAIK